MPKISEQLKKARALHERIGDEIEKWVTDESDPLFGLHVMIERDDRGTFSTSHIRCRKEVVEKRVKKPTVQEGS